jgi:hypothetical protein
MGPELFENNVKMVIYSILSNHRLYNTLILNKYKHLNKYLIN